MLSLRLALDYTSGPHHIKGEDLGLPLCLHPLSTPCRSYLEGLFHTSSTDFPGLQWNQSFFIGIPQSPFYREKKKKNFAASYLSCLQSGNSFSSYKKGVLWKA